MKDCVNLPAASPSAVSCAQRLRPAGAGQETPLPARLVQDETYLKAVKAYAQTNTLSRPASGKALDLYL